jgi:hypothetical protein
MKTSLKRQQAAKIIEEHFACLRRAKPREDVLVSARESGRRLVEVFRLLTGDMPQAAGIDVEFTPDETPALEWTSPVERDPNELYAVDTQPGGPDILTPMGDHHGSSQKEDEEENRIEENTGQGLQGPGQSKCFPLKREGES